MSLRFRRRWFLWQLLGLAACQATKTRGSLGEKWVVGLVSYDQGPEFLNRYTSFQDYLAQKTGVLIQLEPTFNENKALERIRAQEWSIVFARPGLAAIAISQHQYRPIFTLEGVSNLRSVLVVRQDSPLQTLPELAGKTVALGQPGSETGFYLPIYNLYGITLTKIVFAHTPKAVIDAVVRQEADAGALSQAEFNAYHQSAQSEAAPLRLLYTDNHTIPPGVVLLSPDLDTLQQDRIRQVMQDAPIDLIHTVGYLPNQPIPDYRYMISVVERVQPLSHGIYDQPARLF